MKRIFSFLTVSLILAGFLTACTTDQPAEKPNEESKEEPVPAVDPFPIQFVRTQLDTTMVATEELKYVFRYKCYDPFKVNMQLLDNDGMAPQWENVPGSGYARIWSTKRYKSTATCSVKIYDDISEQIIYVTVREKR